MKFINFDKAASTPMHPEAKRAFLKACQGNPSSAHALGRQAKSELEQGRQAIARCLNCEPGEVYFTSGATESCNWMMYCLSLNNRKVFVPTDVHHAVSEYPVPHKRTGDGEFNMVAPLVNNETGQVYDIANLRRHCAHLLGVDATSAVGHIPVDFKALGVDYMAFGGHKFGAPKGIGALIVRKGAPLCPFLYGGAQESGYRGGTTPVPLTAAMAAALEWHTKHMKENMLSVSDVNNELTRYLFILGVKHDNNLPNGAIFAPHILSLRFPGVYGASLAAALSDKGIMVSTGSACSSGSNRPSDVLRAAGLTSQEALSTIRFSFDENNTEQEARTVAGTIAELLPSLKHD